MRRRFFIAMSVAGVLAPASAEVIDRIAVSVGHRAITEEDVDREIRITALLNHRKSDFSAANKRAAAGRMVDQLLVRNELEAAHYPPPTAADTDAALAEEKARYGNDAAYRRALADYGVTEDELKARLTWQLMLVRFIDVRFRPGIQIGEDEIRKYFDEHMRPELMKAHPGQTPSLDDYHAAIERKLESQAADEQVEQWLKEARRRMHVQYRDEAFQ